MERREPNIFLLSADYAMNFYHGRHVAAGAAVRVIGWDANRRRQLMVKTVRFMRNRRRSSRTMTQKNLWKALHESFQTLTDLEKRQAKSFSVSECPFSKKHPELKDLSKEKCHNLSVLGLRNSFKWGRIKVEIPQKWQEVVPSRISVLAFLAL